jgi:hypothetical protein
VLNVRLVSGSDGVRSEIEKKGRADHPYSFIMYRLEGKGRLVIAQGFKAIQTALQNGKLAGEPSVNGSPAAVKDEPKRIAAAIGAASDPDLFVGSMVYLRVPDPE